jgi:hypothetical protein
VEEEGVEGWWGMRVEEYEGGRGWGGGVERWRGGGV